MTGWQMAMELYHAMPTPLAERRAPLSDDAQTAVSETQKAFDACAEEWRRMHAAGLSIREISRRAGCSQKTVSRRL